MACLTDLFQPYCLIILGIFVLAMALLVVYFESKMREQNHKFQSMFSLISALADEVNNVKLGTTYNIIGGGLPNTFLNKHLEENINNINNNFKNILINVSDDEDSVDSDSDDDSDGDSDGDNNEDNNNELSVSEVDLSDNDSTSSDEETIENLEINSSDFKVLKLEENNLGENNLHDYVDLEKNDFDILEVSEQFDNDIDTIIQGDNKLAIPSDITETENLSSELKTIHINLEEQNETLDYKKLPVNKLRSIVIEKSLTTDASKLKRNELLKLLECE